MNKNDEENRNRKEIAQAAFDAWLRKKAKESKQQITAKNVVQKIKCDDDEKNFKAWISLKKDKVNAKRQADAQYAKIQTEKLENRKIIANQEYSKWLSSSNSKPKYVPLNQGLLSK